MDVYQCVKRQERAPERDLEMEKRMAGHARDMAARSFGSIDHWQEDCVVHSDPSSRNMQVLERICSEHPDFADKLAGMHT